MKVDDFLAKQVPGQMTVDEVIAEVEEQAVAPEAQMPEHVTSLTPSGIEVYYQWSPRLYKVRQWPIDDEGSVLLVNGDPLEEWRVVPSVTKVLDVLDKSGPLVWWGQGIGGIGTLKMQNLGRNLDDVHELIAVGDDDAARKALCLHLTSEKISTNHVLKTAGARGVDAHDVCERWAGDQTYRPIIDLYPSNVQGYVVGLVKFLDDIGAGGVADVEAEVMVGSVEHGFAGRFDVRYTLQQDVEVTTRIYPVKKPKREVIPAGRWLKDVKTSKGVFSTHTLQLAAYELASVECGYAPTDHRAVIRVTSDGQYELVRAYATADDFLSVLATHNTMSKSGGWK